MELPVAKFRTHEEAEKADREYYRRLTPEERLKILFELRDREHKERNVPSEGMARVYRIIKLERS
ncbi:MAG TPA: hypothetical protein VG028_07375 [Terriglobia bacterium]|nr:hypothetical protein [Terriglobia bacterium]